MKPGTQPSAAEWQCGRWGRAGTWDSGAEEERPAGEREAVAEEGGQETRRRQARHGRRGGKQRESCFLFVACGLCGLGRGEAVSAWWAAAPASLPLGRGGSH